MRCINPATEEPIATPPMHDSAQVERILARAADAYVHWRRLPLDQRSARMRGVAEVLRRRTDEFCELMITEVGKPLRQARGEIEKCAWACDYFAQHVASMLQAETVQTDASRSYVRYDPIGPILAIMPWNFPFWQVFRFAAPALMAGNVGILKHAPNVPGCAIAIERAFEEAGFGPGVMSTLLIPNEAARAVIQSPHVRAVALTGSTRAGKAVAAQAGEALKKVVLELGGSDPFIVLEDADIPAVAKRAAAARCINAGQSCIAAKRFIVVEAIAAPFEEAMTAEMQALRAGDPRDPATDLGPLARLDLLQNLEDQVRRSIAQGARLRCGGQRLAGQGYFYPPTVLADVQPGMAAFDEETFGPVAAIIRCRDAQDAVRLANLSAFGLGASIWTRDLDRAEQLAAQIESGCVFINDSVKSDPRVPFGGIKDSGIGRELATTGIREFVNIKTVWVA